MSRREQPGDDEPERDAWGRRVPPQSRRRVMMGRILALAGMLVVVVVGVLGIFGSFVMTEYDKTHQVAIECIVTGADGEKAASGGGRGATSFSQVMIETSDCGPLAMTFGINKSNRVEVAAELSEGGSFIFQFGAAEESLRPFFDVFDVRATVYSYSKID
ncbi:hypothetical protein ACIPVK_14460 [Paeniglutamicibacter sp. MACA_103]|uniref:hypothetical protein n=1 Tax=Paeniglutamicibacter sp. MACA_103 TaxID=3377337 RepID=UPI003895D933